MTYDIRLRLFWLYPSIPHHLMRIESILWYTHGIYNTTGAIMLFTTMMRIRV